MAKQTERDPRPSRRLVTERKLDILEWFLNAEAEIDDDDPTPPPIRGRPAPEHLTKARSRQG